MYIRKIEGARTKTELTGAHSCYEVGETLRADVAPADIPEGVDLPGRIEPTDRKTFGGRRRGPGTKVSGIVTVEEVDHSGITDTDDDGGSTGEPYEQTCIARVRPATPEEAEPVLAREQRHTRRDNLKRRAGDLFGYHGTVPDDAYWPPNPHVVGRLLPLPDRGHGPQPAMYQVLIDYDNDVAWLRKYNGMDGDNWAKNNHGAYIAWETPLTDQRRELAAEIIAEWEDPEWLAENLNVPSDAIRLLVDAGWTRDDIAHITQVMNIDSVEDAIALNEWPQQEREAAGWKSGTISSFNCTVRDARRLAQAGITKQKADELNLAVGRDVDQIISAKPPEVLAEATRINIVGKVGAAGAVDSYVAADAETATQWLADHPRQWTAKVQTWTGPRPVHVATQPTEGREWQLWDDNIITVGRWIHGWRDRPRSLPDHGQRLISLLLETQAGAELIKRDKAWWLDLARHTTHLYHDIVTKKENERGSGGSAVELRRYSITRDNGSPLTIWGVRSGWWSFAGGDGDVAFSTTITGTNEADARKLFRETDCETD